MGQQYTIATLGSHSALQILKGAKDEGFSTIVITKEGSKKLYESFKVADEFIIIKDYTDFFKTEDALIKKKAIIIPHASFIAYMGHENVEKIKVPYYGNKKILKYEENRNMEREWLRKAGLRLPLIFKKPEDINRPVIIKFHGAKGGSGYFIARNEDDFKEKIQPYLSQISKNKLKYVIQEYIIGVPVYAHYFYSNLTNELEIMSFDKRYESNVDSLGRISARDQIALQKVDPSYTIIGNIPLVLRESLLPKYIEMGENVVIQSRKLAPKGLFGPFCLETIITPEQEIYVFEISARIVAGTNPFIKGSPYTDIRYNEPMSTGRRIAREIKIAIKQNRLKEILM